VRATNITASSLTFEWDAVPGAVGYTCRLTRASGAGVPIPNTTESTITITGLTEGETYLFTVKARAASPDIDSDYSSPVEATPRGAVEPPEPPEPPEPEPPVGFGPVELPEWEEDNLKRAFPGAEGGGMFTTGGRGGEVIHVTNLNDSGEGSLREAIGKSSVRTIVFDVSGTIQLKSELRIRSGNLTIAGQTAPGDGICVRDYPVRVDADNVIIRYVRFRMGDETNQEGDAIWGRYHHNIILDHCSMSWSTDECASFYANRNFTMQWCLVTESLTKSIHGKGSHGYGGIWGGRNASFHHNLLANHNSRNARLDHPQIYDTYLTTHRGNVDYRNNVIYNWGDNSTYGGEDGHFNVVGNYYKPGPASKQRNYFIDAYNNSNGTQYDYGKFYLSDNYHAGSYASGINADNTLGIYLHQGTGHGSDGMHLTTPLSIKADDTETCYVSTHSSADVFDVVLARVGASLFRDAVDERAVGDARSGEATFPDGGNGSKGGIIDTQSAVGGWPQLTSVAPPADTDGDGMPDEWESLTGLDPADPADGKTFSIDSAKERYTNLELYLHWLVQDAVLGAGEGATYTALQ
jgi:pectate lyase